MRIKRESQYEQEQVQRLNIVIALLLDHPPDVRASMAGKIARLLDLGLTPAQIGRILGRSPNYVSAVLTGKARKPPKRKSKS